MAGTISESYLSRPFTLGKQAGRELVYDIRGTASEADVKALLLATVPTVYQGLEVESVAVEPIEVDTVTGQGVWKGRAKYVRFENDNEYTFDTGGGTTKITQSLDTVAGYAPPGFGVPDFDGAIGVSEDRVDGVEITTPTFVWTETHRFANAAVNQTYIDALLLLTGRVNDASFKGRARGEVLFQGAAGAKRGDELWSITFRFAAERNVTGITIGAMTGIAKEGWQYLWVRYGDFADGPSFTLVKRPVAAYVEQVYEYGDFSQLNIGT